MRAHFTQTAGTRPGRAGRAPSRMPAPPPTAVYTAPPRAPLTEVGAEQPILSIRARIGEPQAAGFIAQALADIRVFIQEHDVRPVGPPFSLCGPADARGLVDIEVGWPLERPIGGSGRIHGGALPRPLARGRSNERTTSCKAVRIEDI